MNLKDTKINLSCLCRFISIHKTNQKNTHRGRRKLCGGIKTSVIEELVVWCSKAKDIVLIQGYTYVISDP